MSSWIVAISTTGVWPRAFARTCVAGSQTHHRPDGLVAVALADLWSIRSVNSNPAVPQHLPSHFMENVHYP
jgi:hypothetical protein